MAGESWTDLLPQNPIFERLREAGALPENEASVMCELRGEFFVWCNHQQALLTTSLKKMMAYPDSYRDFQTLKCLVALEPRVVQLVPDPAGDHIALCSHKNLHVVKLVKQRGRYGEYFGGLKEPKFSPKAIAREFFHIHQHNLKLLQTSWHPSSLHSLLILTSDNTLRLFSLSDPETPVLSIPILATPFASTSALSASPSYTMEEPTTIVAFAVWEKSAFILQESGEVVLASLESGLCSPPLKMCPPSDDNYESESEATSLLVLSTVPCVLVIANCKGKLYHCVYLDDEESCEFLYVAESIHLRREASDSPLTLVPDPLNCHQYFALHDNGVHQMTLPWLTNMEKFLSSDLSDLVTDMNSFIKLDSSVKYLIATDEMTKWVGMTVVSELILGGTVIIGLSSDVECCVLSAQDSRLESSFVQSDDGGRTGAMSTLSDFDQEIDDILHANRTSNPVVKSFSARSYSQQELFQYLTTSISHLKRESLQRQWTAKKAIERKLSVLSQVKDTQITELFRLKEEKERAEEHAEEIQQNLRQLSVKSKFNIRRLEKLACLIDSQSPALSQAQLNMHEELQQLERRVDRISIPVQQAKIKAAEEFKPRESAVSHGLSEKQSNALLTTLTVGRDNIKKLVGEMNSLSSALPD